MVERKKKIVVRKAGTEGTEPLLPDRFEISNEIVERAEKKAPNTVVWTILGVVVGAAFGGPLGGVFGAVVGSIVGASLDEA